MSCGRAARLQQRKRLRAAASPRGRPPNPARPTHRYAPVVASAREGLRLLFAAGIGVRAFGAEDWGFLASHGDGSLVSAWARGAPADSGDDEYLAAGASMAGAVFTPEVLEARKAMDRFVGEILREVLAGDAAGPPCEECTDADGDALNAAHARLDEIIDGEAE